MSRVVDIARQVSHVGASDAGAPRVTDWVIARHLPPVPHELTALVQRLFQGNDTGRVMRSVLFTGVGEEDEAGKVCAGTAVVLAQQTTATVCVVEANLLTPSFASWFHVDCTTGLSTALAGDVKVTDCVIQLRNNLWLLPAGPRAKESSATLAAHEVRACLQELRSTFDHVLVHAADIGPQGDVFALAPAADGVVVVIDATQTRAASARRLVDELKAARVTVLGAVLTNRGFPIPSALYRRL
jgi:Mrp family chromosome partitioning ATPase